MDMVWVLDQAWCRSNGVQVRLRCISCANERAIERMKNPPTILGEALDEVYGYVEFDAVGGRDVLHTSFADLTAWMPPLGLSPKLYEYLCKQGHKNYAEMPEINTGRQFKKEPAKGKLAYGR